MLTRKEFDKAQERIVTGWRNGDLPSAFAECERVLLEGTEEMKTACYLLRGMIWESKAATDKAKEDWLNGLQYAVEGTFLRYELQQNIGEAAEKQGKIEEALDWYRQALRTCSSGDQFSGDRTLTSFVHLLRSNIVPEDEPLIASVVEKSWRVLQLPGKPDLSDLARAIQQLTEGFAKMRDEIISSS